VSRWQRAWQSPWLGLALVVLVAACLRYPLLDSVPPGLNFDEGGEGMAALDVAHGDYHLWWPIGGGKEPLMAYLVQPLFWAFGPTRLALRLYTATLGVIAAAGTFWLAWEIAAALMPGASSAGLAEQSPAGSPVTTGTPAASPLGFALSARRLTSGLRSLLLTPYSLLPTPYSPLPLLSGLGVATAFWLVAYSRIAFRALAMPAVEALALAWFWRAIRVAEGPASCRARMVNFAGAGFFLGLGGYTYLAGRFVPLAIILFLAVEAALAWLRHGRPLVVRHWRGMLVAAGAAGLVFSPLAVFFAAHPAAFIERAGSVSIFSPAWNAGDLWGALWRSLVTTLGSWAGLTGDPNPLGNLPGRPMLSLPLIPFFWLGLALSIRRVLRAAPERDGAHPPLLPTPYSLLPAAHLFLLCVWPVMLLPGVLAPEGAPHHLRLIGTAPVTYVWVALGLAGAGGWIWRVARGGLSWMGPQVIARLGRLAASPAGALAIFVPIGLATGMAYFGRWAELPELAMAYDVYAVELAQHIAADTLPGAAYLIPMDQRAGSEARHYTLDFMYHGQTPYQYVPVDETTVAQGMTQAAAGRTTLRVVRWTQDKHAAADERELVGYLLATTARQVDRQVYPVYTIETWALPSSHTVFSLPAIESPVGVTYGGLLRLEAAALSAGREAVSVTLRWAPVAPMEVDYKASLRLVAADGSLAAQKDRFLRHNWHQGTSLWPPAETVNEYYWFPAVSPGTYQVQVVVYHPETLAPLIADGRAAVPVGTVQVK